MTPASFQRIFLWLLLAGVCARGTATETEKQWLSGRDPSDAVPWEFFCTDGRNSRVWTTIPVPSVWEQQGFGTYNYGGELHGNHDQPTANEQGLYRHRFTVPEAWRGRVVRIVFDAAMTDTSVWINGQSAGLTHQGGFYRFHYDITPLVRFGAENTLEVTVAKMSANHHINLAERAADYWAFGGIYRPVWLEALPRQFVDWSAIDAKHDGTFAAAVHLGADTAEAAVEAQVLDPNGQPVGEAFRAAVENGTARLRAKFDAIAPWTAETPRLYQVRFTLLVKGVPVHTTQERFGFRTIEVRENDGVYVNGRKVVLRGVNRHCFSPDTGRAVTRAQSYADVKTIKEMNMNAVRAAHYPPDTHFLEACDELGLYVLDEIAGWQKSYNAVTSARLIAQTVKRDVNHPSILFWDNGNEGGWVAANDGEFAKWDPQQRPVLHPWATNSGINTDHYENYASTTKLSAGPTIFMPTEFLHGLYDGGAGTGLEDYWATMGNSPTVAGGFLWAFADEGVARADRGGAIDNAGNLAPDGVVGPRGEKDGSFAAIREIWSPVVLLAPVNGAALPRDWDGTLSLENRYHFTDLSACTLAWKRLRFPAAPGAESIVVTAGELAAPAAPAGARATVSLPPDAWTPTPATAGIEALHVTVRGPGGEALFTWSWPLAAPPAPAKATGRVMIADQAATLEITGGDTTWIFERATGRLAGVRKAGRDFPLADGPRAVAYRRLDRQFESVALEGKLTSLKATPLADGTVRVEANYDGTLQQASWSIDRDGAQLDYTYAFDGAVNLLGVEFSLPENAVRTKSWLGRGPHRVYQNRLRGGVFDLWRVPYNDPIPGQTYASPEFKGFFAAWTWLELETTEGRLQLSNLSGVPYHGLFRAKDGVDGLLAWPPLGVAFLDVIPAQRTKFDAPEDLGPQGQTPVVTGARRGTLKLRIVR